MKVAVVNGADTVVVKMSDGGVVGYAGENDELVLGGGVVAGDEEGGIGLEVVDTVLLLAVSLLIMGF